MPRFLLVAVICAVIITSIKHSDAHVCMTDKPDDKQPSSNSPVTSPSSVTSESSLGSRDGEPNALSHSKKVVCYYGSWAVYRPEKGKFPVENIDPYLCTHLIYTFTGLGFDNKIRALDPWNDLKDDYGRGAFERFTNLRRKNSHVKTMIAIGGWNEGSIKYSTMTANPSARQTFVESVLNFLQKYEFDGLDLDWEYPAARGGKPEDKPNFSALVRELKTAFQSKGYLLSAAVSAGKWFIDPAYDVPEISRHLDFINVMAYDFHGGWENKTGHSAPLYARPEEVGKDRICNVDYAVKYWIASGAPPEKINLGMGTYGRSFTLQREENHGLQAFAPQTGMAGPYTREAGSLGYNEICESFLREKWTIVRDPYHMAPYAFRDRQWVGYDDMESIALKALLAVKMNLGGAMFWSLETDDFLGVCHGTRYPLISTVNRVFASDSFPELPTPPPAPEKEDDDESPSSSSTTVRPPSTPDDGSWKPGSTEASTSSTWWPQSSTSTTTSTTTRRPELPPVPSLPTDWWIPSASTTAPSLPPTQPSTTSTTTTTTTTSTTTTTTEAPQSSSSTETPSSSISTDWWQNDRSGSSTTAARRDGPESRPSSSSSTTHSWEREREGVTERTTARTPFPGWEREGTESTSRPSTSSSTLSPWWPYPPSTSVPVPVPAGPKPSDEPKCTSAGTFRHPSDCRKFYRCVEMGIEYRFVLHQYTCPHNTVFDENSRLCLWAASVPDCSNYYNNKNYLNEIEREDQE